VNQIRERIVAAARQGEASMDRSELLEVASQYLDRVIILLTVAGEDRLAQDIDWLDFPGLPPDAKPMPRIAILIQRTRHLDSIIASALRV
jgi:hypothetical protein